MYGLENMVQWEAAYQQEAAKRRNVETQLREAKSRADRASRNAREAMDACHKLREELESARALLELQRQKAAHEAEACRILRGRLDVLQRAETQPPPVMTEAFPPEPETTRHPRVKTVPPPAPAAEVV